MFQTSVYPHNDLLNLARYHRDVVNSKHETGNQDALALDCMSCIISMAFSVEALVNFVGAKKTEGWKEKVPLHQKINALKATIGLRYDTASEPGQTLEVLKELRNMMAHGQPIEVSLPARSKVAINKALSTPWDDYLNPEFVNHAYMQVDAFEKELLAVAGIDLTETLTSGFTK